jgi:2,3-bisphosphoglycerate-dependent phosphoglycerate mutase
MFRTLTIGKSSRELAPDRAVEAMFTTIGCRLEPQGRGTRFPAVMDDLYAGYLTPARAPGALKELDEIEACLRTIPITQVICSLADLRRGGDSDEGVNHRASNVFDYFIDVDGRPLTSRLRDGVQECLNSQQPMRLGYPGETRNSMVVGAALTFLGFAWLFLGHTLIPGWTIGWAGNPKSRLPVWTFGMDFVMLGIGILIAAPLPGLSDWFRRRPAVLGTVAIVAVIAWLIICACVGFLPD